MNGRHAGTTSPERLDGVRARSPGGFTCVELSIAIVIIGVLLSLVVPSFVRVAEQNRVDAASQYLRPRSGRPSGFTGWKTRLSPASLSDLQALGLIDTKIAAGNDGYFNYSITDATSSTFTVDAVHSASWILDGHAARFGNR